VFANDLAELLPVDKNLNITAKRLVLTSSPHQRIALDGG
jgi:hypothetical protein